jgi:hypothetical protein
MLGGSQIELSRVSWLASLSLRFHFIKWKAIKEENADETLSKGDSHNHQVQHLESKDRR